MSSGDEARAGLIIGAVLTLILTALSVYSGCQAYVLNSAWYGVGAVVTGLCALALAFILVMFATT